MFKCNHRYYHIKCVECSNKDMCKFMKDEEIFFLELINIICLEPENVPDNIKQIALSFTNS